MLPIYRSHRIEIRCALKITPNTSNATVQKSTFLQVAPHPEYPSASTSFCMAYAETARRFFSTDTLAWETPYAAGSSKTEPGVTPVSDTILSYPTWTDFARDCGDSRVWAGVHFPDAVPAGQKIASEVSEHAWEFFQKHLNGDV